MAVAGKSNVLWSRDSNGVGFQILVCLRFLFRTMLIVILDIVITDSSPNAASF